MDRRLLNQMVGYTTQRSLDLRGVFIVRNGYKVFELAQAPATPETLFEGMSVTKSVISALFGLALKGDKTALDKPLKQWFPEQHFSDPRTGEIKLKELLAMGSGIAFPPEESAQNLLLRFRPGILDRLLNQPQRTAPGQIMDYNTSQTMIAMRILKILVGKDPGDFADETLFGPIGVKQHLWMKDADGISYGGSNLFLTLEDFARFGWLFAQHGLWDGRQLIDRDWVDLSTTAKFPDYGYGWWMLSPGTYAARGYRGQWICITPALNLVAVLMSSTNEPRDTLNLYTRFILPSVRDQALIPSSPADSTLDDWSVHAAQPVRLKQVFPNPTAVETLLGKRIVLAENTLGLAALEFGYDQGKDQPGYFVDFVSTANLVTRVRLGSLSSPAVNSQLPFYEPGFPSPSLTSLNLIDRSSFQVRFEAIGAPFSENLQVEQVDGKCHLNFSSLGDLWER